MVNKRLINTGAEAAPAAFDPLQNFETVTYTGNGGTQKITGYIRKGAAFNGSSSKIVTSDIGAKTGDISISAWVYFNDVSGVQPVVCRDLTTTTRRLQFRNNDGTINAYWFHSGGLSALDSNTSVVANQWYHIVTTWEDGVASKIYINGSLDATDSTGIGTRSSLEYITIGYLEQGNTFLNGKIDQVRIFNKVLDSGDVDDLYLETYADPKKSTTDYFGDGSGVSLYELDEDANDTGVYPLGQGAIDSGQSGFFGGNNDRLTASNFSSVLGTNRAFTISGWFFPSSISNGLDAITAWSTTGTTAANFVLGRHSGGTWQYRLGHANSNEIKVVFSDSYVTDKWVHVAFTYDGSKNASGVTLYLNGVAATVSSINDNNLTTNTDYPNFAIGYGAWNGDYYNGYVDQVRIYSSELSSSEVNDLAKETNVPTSTLVAHYKLDGNANDETTNYNGSAPGVTYGYDAAEFPLIAYNGTPTNVNFLGMAFQPDLVWIKNRIDSTNHVLHDSVRGKSSILYSDLSNAADVGSNFQSFDTNGFTVGGSNYYNGLNDGMVAWCWKAGGSVTPNNNTDGTITSTVSANPDAGFSIVSYTGTGANGSFGHGLSAAPEMVIIKSIDQSTRNWITHFSSLGAGAYMSLNLTSANATSTARINTTTSTVVNIGTSANVNLNGDRLISYCFHSVDGYQRIGSYGGTGSARTIYTTDDGTSTGNGGFQPRFLMIKRSNGSGRWLMIDYERTASLGLAANFSNAEGGSWGVSFLGDGFSLSGLSASDAETNAIGGTYIYLAIA